MRPRRQQPRTPSQFRGDLFIGLGKYGAMVVRVGTNGQCSCSVNSPMARVWVLFVQYATRCRHMSAEKSTKSDVRRHSQAANLIDIDRCEQLELIFLYEKRGVSSTVCLCRWDHCVTKRSINRGLDRSDNLICLIRGL